jgi:plasmid maintenance system killer protein
MFDRRVSPPNLEKRDDSTTDRDLRMPPSNHFEKLRGDQMRFPIRSEAWQAAEKANWQAKGLLHRLVNC